MKKKLPPTRDVPSISGAPRHILCGWPAPLFDHGNSLFNFAGEDVWQSEESLNEYIETLYPSVYDDFLGTAKAWMTPEHRQKLRHLLEFRFKKHSRYNLPEQRLRLIETQIQKRAKSLLEM